MTWFSMLVGFAALALVLWIQRRCGPRVAGMCVCLPLTSGPLALAVYLAGGAEAAQAVVVGSVDAIGGAAVSLTAWSAMRRWPMWVSVPVTLLIFVATVSVKNMIAMTPMQAVLATAFVIGLCVAVSQRFSSEHTRPPCTARANGLAHQLLTSVCHARPLLCTLSRAPARVERLARQRTHPRACDVDSVAHWQPERPRHCPNRARGLCWDGGETHVLRAGDGRVQFRRPRVDCVCRWRASMFRSRARAVAA
jgi:hypothetical protein